MTIARRLAFAFLYACGALSLVMLVPLRWSAIPLLVLALLAGWAAFHYSRGAAVEARLTPIDAVTLLLIIGYGFYTTVASPWEWDFWAIWGLKGRVFYEARGVDWAFLQTPWNDFTHPDYPNLVPFHYAFLALLGGGWDDRWLGLSFVAFALALLVIVRDRAARELPPPLASLVALAIASQSVTRYVGMAEGPLIAYGTAGLLYARCGGMAHAAILLGFAACTKNEGLTLLAAVAIALLAERRGRDVLRLWPAAVIVAPWLLLRAVHGLGTDLASGSPLQRAAAHLQETAILFGYLADYFPDRWLWLGILAGIATTWIVGRTTKTERFLVVAVAAQFAFFVIAYFVTPRDLQWHIETSWERLVRQLEAPALFAALLGLARYIAPHAEARPQQ
ncbi:MAG TPA: hypothetical protein VGR02_17475 [Thermoanaerobaculia bacterium]|jgi:hypothetical protein|nr:hypothetical protein [Thermoanaerobaculia bacterium]